MLISPGLFLVTAGFIQSVWWCYLFPPANRLLDLHSSCGGLSLPTSKQAPKEGGPRPCVHEAAQRAGM